MNSRFPTLPLLPSDTHTHTLDLLRCPLRGLSCVASPATKTRHTWKCGGCKLYFHQGCEQEPPPETDVMGLRCSSCVILKAQFVKKWQQQQPPPPEVVAAVAISNPADETKRRGPMALARSHVHQMYKLRCRAATSPASLLAAGANGRAATPPARRSANPVPVATRKRTRAAPRASPVPLASRV